MNWTPIYCVLSKSGLIRYYRKRNDYYLNLKNVKGVINVSGSQIFSVQKVGSKIRQLKHESFDEGEPDKMWRFSMGNEETRDQ